MRMFIFAVSMLVSITAAAQQYKWVDSNGRTQYSDHPPAGTGSAAVKRQIGSATGAPGAAGSSLANARPLTPVEQEQAFRKRRADEQEKAQKQAKAEEANKEKQEACVSAKQSLAGLEAGGRKLRYTASGEREFMNEDDIAGEKERTRKVVADACN